MAVGGWQTVGLKSDGVVIAIGRDVSGFTDIILPK